MRAFVLAALMVCAAPLWGQDVSQEAAVNTPAPDIPAIVPTGNDGASRMTVPVMVNGQGPFAFVIDTGADRTVV